MKAQGYLLFGLLFAVLIAVFAVVNGNNVEFNYIFGSVKWPLVLIILGSAAIGGLAVGLLGFIKIIQLKNAVKRLERERPVKVETAEVQHHSPVDTDVDTSGSRLQE
ncbi:LapA family protein [Fictibacillus sp. FJAT-27399]|uniref:LapA family protein n=1 Tax=Fictibacillus sp. FJAT-27399 TaxID=1729689 RepID=UPI00078591CF|nr:lipopolysaccharide assembly protein LapA domain-containing protein [Fictibacillus sp. FJAT-27399]